MFLINFIKKYQVFLFAVSGILMAFIIYWPSHDILPFLVQGDTGRDLYVYKRTSEGAIPLRDTYYSYGPLMSYYYAIYIKVLGVHISSILWGRIVLNIFAGLLIYFSLVRFIAPTMAFMAAVWFWVYNVDFPHAFNHAGGVLIILLQIHLLLKYIEKPNIKLLFTMVPVLFSLFLIKTNMGLVILLTSILAIFLIDSTIEKNSKVSIRILHCSILATPIILILIFYSFLFYGLSDDHVRQCSLYLIGGNDQFARPSFLNTFLILMTEIKNNLNGFSAFDVASMSTFFSPLPYRIIVLISFFATFWFIYPFRKQPINNTFKKERLFIIILLTTLIAVLHEFILSAVHYRLLWSYSILVMLMFLMIGLWTRSWRFFSQVLLFILLTCLIILDVHGKYSFRQQITSNPSHFVALDGAEVYVKNPVQWIRTVSHTTEYLNKSLGQNESFLAIPYEPLYYYLTNKTSPVPEDIFFDFFFYSMNQDNRIIADLEKKSVNYVLLSNRCVSSEQGLGTFGTSYCSRLAAYIYSNFECVATFGDWKRRPSWFDGHAVKIYKRKHSLSLTRTSQ